MRNFRNYEIYQEAMNIATLVYRKTRTFPKSELFSLTNQLNRAVVSIASNIAEGASRESEKEIEPIIDKLGKIERQLNQLIIMLNNNKVEVSQGFSQSQSQRQSKKL